VIPPNDAGLDPPDDLAALMSANGGARCVMKVAWYRPCIYG
jgi:hypothetical protein